LDECVDEFEFTRAACEENKRTDSIAIATDCETATKKYILQLTTEYVDPDKPRQSTRYPSQRYPTEVRKNFLQACNASSSGRRSACKCALLELEGRVAYATFKQADAAIRKGSRAAPATENEINRAIRVCS
jgi:hypothetical protein